MKGGRSIRARIASGFVVISWRQLVAVFCRCRVCFEQVRQQEVVRAEISEIDEGGQVSLEGCLLTIRAIHQQLPVTP